MNGNLTSFIAGLKGELSKQDTLTIVMGNEAADLDSMVSALAYAWYLKLTSPEAHPIPLINIPRADFKLRGEAVYLFTEAGIDCDSLVFLEDVDLQGLKARGRLQLILVDHNKLASGQSALKGALVEVLDHHGDEKNYPSSVKTDIRPVGSAATLVAEGFLKNRPEALDGRLGTLLLGTILLDTVNLKPAAGRVTDADRAVVTPLLERTGIGQKALFDKLQFEKFSISPLGSYDLLRRDYKEWVMGTIRCGIGSIPMSAGDWLEKDGAILGAFKKYLKERKLDVLLTMNAYGNPNFHRDLVVYVPEEALRKTILDFLETAEMALELIETSFTKGEGLVFYRQGNPGISRKRLQPLLNRLFAG